MSSLAYFAVRDDFSFPGRWYLNGLSDSADNRFDIRVFGYGQALDLTRPMQLKLYKNTGMTDVRRPLRIALRRRGSPLDFTLGDADVPVIRRSVVESIASYLDNDVQRIPVKVDSQSDEFEIINVVSRVPCIDPLASEIQWWTAGDGRPDKVGKPRMITKLVIDPTRVAGHHVFRPEGWEVTMIVSEVVKTALEAMRVTGVTFHPV